MKRGRRRLFALLALFPLLAGCHLFDAATTPSSAFGPCKSWVDCGPNEPAADRCCPPRQLCSEGAGGDKYCSADAWSDPSDPNTFGSKMRQRFERSAQGE